MALKYRPIKPGGEETIIIVSINHDITRKELKDIARLFPVTSEADQRHQTTNLSAFLWNFINPSVTNQTPILPTRDERLQAINDVLQHIRVGTNQIMLLDALITIFGHAGGLSFRQDILEAGVLLRSSLDQHKLLKAITTAAKRSKKSTRSNINHQSAQCYMLS